ncbi:ABC transporter permease [Sphingomonas sp. LB-2]|uniref:ABC transporter permease n=1 Tax=Sphingomonas caeni TaxID=2984949 RepID=UPI0022303390|nr:ABC transporter permease [Sphingomonas caeni]MCW3847863.1 ABC transporter permease [Sphingomonas caeni]
MSPSLRRIWAMLIKEFHQLRRDRLTFGMIVGIPLVQLFLFGFAINNDPRHLRAALEVNDHSAFTRSIEGSLRASSYFDLQPAGTRPGAGEEMLRRGEVQFLIVIPPDFSRDLVRGEHPQLLVVADATDPAATGGATAAVQQAVMSGLGHDLIGSLAPLAPRPPPVDVVVQRRYNPEGITSHNIVPGLLAIVLSMTMVMLTSVSVARERERGTMENLLAMPLHPLEVMLGKILPYVFIGATQTTIIVAAAQLIFQVPFFGPVWLLALATLVFITVSLLLGFTLSTFAQTQLQAMQMSFFYILPSILLSGFMFPFRGMPGWAQTIGECIPVTHFLRVVRGVMLKGWGVGEALLPLGILAAMGLVFAFVAVRRYGDTLE